MSTSLPQQSLFDFEPSLGDPSGMSSSKAPAILVETLSIADLMRNPHVQSMYNNSQELTNQVLQSSQLQQTLWQEKQNLWQEKQNLWQENCRLSAEVRALQVLQSQTRYTAMLMSNQYITYFIATPNK
jgi:hypothetical protein